MRGGERICPESNVRCVGVVGAGVMGCEHLKAWRRVGVPIVGVYARNRESGRVAAEACGCLVFDSVPALLGQADIADICLPTFMHRTAVEQAVQANCDIVCEKPLALEPEDVKAIFDLCEGAGVRLFVAMVVRFFPAYRNVWESVRGGAFGAVRKITLKRVGSPPPPAGSWLLNDSFSGGMLTDLLIHDVDYATWLAGDVATVHVTAQCGGRLQYAHLTLEHTSGAVSRIEGGWSDGAPRLDTSGHVTCTEGDIPMALKSLYPPTEDPYVAQLCHFNDSLLSGAPFLVSRSEVLRDTRVMAAARTSAGNGHVVPIESIVAGE